VNRQGAPRAVSITLTALCNFYSDHIFVYSVLRLRSQLTITIPMLANRIPRGVGIPVVAGEDAENVAMGKVSSTRNMPVSPT
jgi:hypothetical protein